MEFMVFKFNNGRFLSSYRRISEFGCESLTATKDIHKAHIFTLSEYKNVAGYFSILAGSFTKFKITEV